MRREVKFRGFGLDKKWYVGDLRHNGSSLRIEWEITDWKAMPPLGTIIQVGKNVKKETVGQYTGLIDINSKEICEHDLLKDDEGFIWKVFYKQGAFYAECSDLMAEQLLSTVNLYSQVVGNIHEKTEVIT